MCVHDHRRDTSAIAQVHIMPLQNNKYSNLSLVDMTPPGIRKWCMGPPPTKDITLMENVQKFGLRICAKQWDLGYDELMSNFDVCTLQTRRLEHKLCTMFKTVHNLISSPIRVPRHSRIGYNAYLQPFAHTNSFLYFFVPSTISLWNSLPSDITSTPYTLAIFKACIHQCT